MSVDSGLSGPFEGPAAAPPSRRTTATQRAARPRDDHAEAVLVEPVPDLATTTPRPAPSPRRRRKGRRVTRVVRRIELWSVLKIALVFNTVMLAIVLGSVALLWGLANTTGLVDDLEGFLRDAGFEDFRFQGDRMFEQVAFIGAVGTLAFTVFIVLTVALVNLISEITGGIRFSVIEEIPDDRDLGRPGGPLPAAPAVPPPPAVAPPVTGHPVAPGFGPAAPAAAAPPRPPLDAAPSPPPRRAAAPSQSSSSGSSTSSGPRGTRARGSAATKPAAPPPPRGTGGGSDATIPLAPPASSAVAKAARPRTSPPKKGRSGAGKGTRTTSRMAPPDTDGPGDDET